MERWGVVDKYLGCVHPEQVVQIGSQCRTVDRHFRVGSGEDARQNCAEAHADMVLG